jgi:hypothetical protein
MPKKSLRSQLNQVRAWVQQGRTDAWIAHQLEVSASELREFRRRHKLTSDGGEPTDVDLRDEIEAEIEAATLAAEEEEEELDEEDEEEGEDEGAEPEEGDEDEGSEEPEGSEEGEEPREAARPRGRERAPRASERGESESGRGEAGGEGEEGETRPRRRRRRGGRRRRGRGGGRRALEATFDHGEEGYGLWLDPAVADDPAYAEHWRGHRAVEVEIEADRITIRRAGQGKDSQD